MWSFKKANYQVMFALYRPLVRGGCRESRCGAAMEIMVRLLFVIVSTTE